MKIKEIIIAGLVLCSFNCVQLVAQCPDELETININSQDELDAFIERNPDCTHLEELNIGGDVSDLSGLSSIRSIDWFYIYDCPNLMDLSGFENVDTVSGNLGFEGFNNLKNFCGLGIKFIGQDLRIDECHSLENLNGLESITTVMDDIRIVDNNNLISINGLQNVQSELVDQVRIQNNPKLNDCCGVQHLVNDMPEGDVFIFDNDENCNSNDEIINTICEFSSIDCSSISTAQEMNIPQFKMIPNPASSYFKVDLDYGNQIEEVSLYSLSGKRMLQTHSIDHINIEHLEDGIYLLRLRVDGKAVSKMLTIVK